MSFFRTAGSVVGSTAASIYVGSGVARTEFSAGVAEGYAARAVELNAQRKALGLKPAPVVQRKLATKAKA
jgi:hypothetical protein